MPGKILDVVEILLARREKIIVVDALLDPAQNIVVDALLDPAQHAIVC